jgi:beta-glucosidase
MARGASWDPALERRVHSAISAEAKAIGANVLLSPCINLVRHPGWGRCHETYGEDTCHLTRFAVAATQGIQEHVMAQVKHFALNNIEEDRYTINAAIDERTLREVYLPHFHATVAEGNAASFLSAYNKVNGQYCRRGEQWPRHGDGIVGALRQTAAEGRPGWRGRREDHR